MKTRTPEQAAALARPNQSSVDTLIPQGVEAQGLFECEFVLCILSEKPIQPSGRPHQLCQRPTVLILTEFIQKTVVPSPKKSKVTSGTFKFNPHASKNGELVYHKRLQ